MRSRPCAPGRSPPIAGPPPNGARERWKASWAKANPLRRIGCMRPPAPASTICGRWPRKAGWIWRMRKPRAIRSRGRVLRPPFLRRRPKSRQAALQPILAALSARRAERFLLFGITGSGKTEVYLRAAKAAVESRPQGDCAGSGNRAHPADGSAFRRAVSRPARTGAQPAYRPASATTSGAGRAPDIWT